MVARLSVVGESGIEAWVEWPDRPSAGDVQLALDGLLLAVGAQLDGPVTSGPNGNVPSDWAAEGAG